MGGTESTVATEPKEKGELEAMEHHLIHPEIGWVLMVLMVETGKMVQVAAAEELEGESSTMDLVWLVGEVSADS